MVVHKWTALPNRAPRRGALFVFMGRSSGWVGGGRDAMLNAESAHSVAGLLCRYEVVGRASLAWRNLRIIV